MSPILRKIISKQHFYNIVVLNIIFFQLFNCQLLPVDTNNDDTVLINNDFDSTAQTTTLPKNFSIINNNDENSSSTYIDDLINSEKITTLSVSPSSLSSVSTLSSSSSSTANPLINRDSSIHYGIDAELKCQTNNDCPDHSECVEEFCRCQKGHCKNEGKCSVLNPNEVYCFCNKNFSGHRCEYRNQPCGSNHNCQNGATCNQTLQSCICRPGYNGENCEHIVQTCDTMNCLNNGHCQIIEPEGLAICQCADGFDGKNCENNIDDCPKLNPCKNGGRCVDGINKYTCECIHPYHDTNCTDILNPCKSSAVQGESPCKNGGECSVATDFLSYTCNCPSGFTGKHCEINIDDCIGHNCTNGQICVDLINDYRCECPPGYEGPGCKNLIDHCKQHKCQNGDCINNLTTYSCNCTAGYEGEFCEKDIDECTLHQPCVNGLCVNLPGSFECYCRPGFTGPLCQLDIDECLSGPCQNNGTCKNLQSTYECDCPKGYSGKNCEQEVDECKSNPCKNGATCTDLIGSYHCQCPPGIQGSQCHLDIDECQEEPCQNGGTCFNELATYHCKCPHGFEGEHCEKDVDECVISPCQNNGTCVNRNGTYECTCVPGYRGHHCEQDINECIESFNEPCMNGGRCIDLINKFECDCNGTGFEGLQCENEINECHPMPCSELGTLRCEDLHLNFSCHCRNGFTGRHCEIDIDECESNPCQNGGTCQQKPHDTTMFGQNYRDKYELDDLSVLRHGHQTSGGYQCTCAPGFEGIDCEINKDDCQINHCQNGGICIDEINSYSCQCSYGYEGKLCQYLIDPCISSPCRNGATCLKKSNDSYTCECAIGYIGERCDRRRSCFMPECHPEHSHCVKKNTHSSMQHTLCACLPNPVGLYDRSHCDPIYNCSIATNLCLNGGTCVQSGRGYYCICPDDHEGLICEKKKRINIVVILIATMGAIMTIALAVIMLIVFRSIKRARATRGTYSPSTQEMFGNSAGEILKPPPEERLI